MKKITLFFLLLSSFAQAQLILGGGGTCHVDADPNTIVAIAAQNQAACKQAINTTTGIRYYYDDTQVAGAKWVQVENSKTLQRTIPTVVNDMVSIGSWSNNANLVFKVDICVQPLGICKSYTITMNANGIGGSYNRVPPIMSSIPTTNDDFDLVISAPSAFTTQLGIVRVRGTTSGTAYIKIEQTGALAIFTPSSVVAPSITYPNTFPQYGNSTANIRTYTATFTAAFDDDTIVANSAITMVGTLPAANTCLGKQYTLVNIGTGQLLLTPSYRVNNTTTSAGLAASNRITVHSNGTDWIQIR